MQQNIVITVCTNKPNVWPIVWPTVTDYKQLKQNLLTFVIHTFSFLKVAQIDHCIVEQIQYKIKDWIIYDSACKLILKNSSNI